jgi:hypothetical protein
MAPLFMQSGLFLVLVVIVTNKVILFLDHIHKEIPSGIDPIYSKLFYGNFIPVSFPPIFYMGRALRSEKVIFSMSEKL